MTRSEVDAAREAARIAQIGYTAVIDRMTPALDLSIVSANVARSVGSAGGAPTQSPPLAEAWGSVWPRGAVTLFAADQAEGPFGTTGTFAFAITVEALGSVGALAATAVLHEPSAQLRGDAAALSSALRAVIEGIRPGVTATELSSIFAAEADRVSVPVELVVRVLAGDTVRALAPDDLIADGDDVAIGAVARSAEGPIAFQTTVHVSAAGAERLEDFPLRLIELR